MFVLSCVIHSWQREIVAAQHKETQISVKITCQSETSQLHHIRKFDIDTVTRYIKPKITLASVFAVNNVGTECRLNSFKTSNTCSVEAKTINLAAETGFVDSSWYLTTQPKKTVDADDNCELCLYLDENYYPEELSKVVYSASQVNNHQLTSYWTTRPEQNSVDTSMLLKLH
jgi:hypothetical protein